MQVFAAGTQARSLVHLGHLTGYRRAAPSWGRSYDLKAQNHARTRDAPEGRQINRAGTSFRWTVARCRVLSPVCPGRRMRYWAPSNVRAQAGILVPFTVGVLDPSAGTESLQFSIARDTAVTSSRRYLGFWGCRRAWWGRTDGTADRPSVASRAQGDGSVRCQRRGSQSAQRILAMAMYGDPAPCPSRI